MNAAVVVTLFQQQVHIPASRLLHAAVQQGGVPDGAMPIVGLDQPLGVEWPANRTARTYA